MMAVPMQTGPRGGIELETFWRIGTECGRGVGVASRSNSHSTRIFDMDDRYLVVLVEPRTMQLSRPTSTKNVNIVVADEMNEI